MTLEEMEKLARNVAAGMLAGSDRSMYVHSALGLARFALAVLPVVRAAESAQLSCVDYGYCEQCGDHCGNCTTYGDHRDDCDANPKRLAAALATMHTALAKGDV